MTKERFQLEEREDVKQHRELTEKKWEELGQLLKVREIRKVFKGVAVVNLNTFMVEQGEVFGLLGPNGAGKSTFFKMMTMDLKRTSGHLRLLDTDLERIDVVKHGNKMGMCPQENHLWQALTVD